MHIEGSTFLSLPVFFILICFQAFLFHIHFLIQNLHSGGNKLWWSVLYDTTGTFIKIWRATSMFPTLLNSVPLLCWSELSHQQCLCTSSGEISGTFARTYVKGWKTSLSNRYLKADFYQERTFSRMCHLPKIKVSVQQCFFHGDFLLSRIPPTLTVGVLDVLGPVCCRSGRSTSLWGNPPRLNDECRLTAVTSCVV